MFEFQPNIVWLSKFWYALHVRRFTNATELLNATVHLYDANAPLVDGEFPSQHLQPVCRC